MNKRFWLFEETIGKSKLIVKKGERQIQWSVPSHENETKATLFILRSLLDSHVVLFLWGQEMHIKIS